MGCGAQLAWKSYLGWLFSAGDFDPKVGQTALVVVWDDGSLVDLCTQDYKSLCAAVTICSTLVNVHTYPHIQTAFWPAYMKTSAGWAKTGLSVSTAKAGKGHANKLFNLTELWSGAGVSTWPMNRMLHWIMIHLPSVHLLVRVSHVVQLDKSFCVFYRSPILFFV